MVFRKLITPRTIEDLKDLMYDEDGNGLDPPFQAPDDMRIFLKELFKESDRDNSGTLDREEALDVLMLDLEFSEIEAIKCFNSLDTSDDQALNEVLYCSCITCP
jgi:hypothetical protein